MSAPVVQANTRPLPMLSASRLDLATECLFPWTGGLEWPEGD